MLSCGNVGASRLARRAFPRKRRKSCLLFHCLRQNIPITWVTLTLGAEVTILSLLCVERSLSFPD